MTFAEIKKELDLSNTQIAQILGFKSVKGYENSSAKERYKKALTEFYNLISAKQTN